MGCTLGCGLFIFPAQRGKYLSLRSGENTTRRRRISSHGDFIHASGFHLPKADFIDPRDFM
jgi:hypothetical protein